MALSYVLWPCSISPMALSYVQCPMALSFVLCHAEIVENRPFGRNLCISYVGVNKKQLKN